MFRRWAILVSVISWCNMVLACNNCLQLTRNSYCKLTFKPRLYKSNNSVFECCIWFLYNHESEGTLKDCYISEFGSIFLHT